MGCQLLGDRRGKQPNFGVERSLISQLGFSVTEKYILVLSVTF